MQRIENGQVRLSKSGKGFFFQEWICKFINSQESLACCPAQITVDGIAVTDPNTILRFFYGNYLTSNYLQTLSLRDSQIYLFFLILCNQITRVGSEIVYHRLPWREPDTPYLLEVLYEDDDMVIFFFEVFWFRLRCL